MFSGETNETHTNFWLASGLSSSSKSTYLGFADPSGLVFLSKLIIYEYKNFVDRNEEKLESKFSETIAYQTSTRGLKVRGVYPTQQEAEFRAKKLREVDPNFDVYVGPVGVWMPWEPEAYKTPTGPT
jgi:hypothetical protein